MVTTEDLIVIDYSREREVSAEYFSMQRVFFEYPRTEFERYSEALIDSIKANYLGEFAFMEYVTWLLYEKYRIGNKWYDITRKEHGFSYMIAVDVYEKDNPDNLTRKIFDVKTHNTAKVTREAILGSDPLVLTIDLVQHPKADIYVQSFILDNNDIVLAGYRRRDSKLRTRAVDRLCSIPATELEKMEDLIGEFGQ